MVGGLKEKKGERVERGGDDGLLGRHNESQPAGACYVLYLSLHDGITLKCTNLVEMGKALHNMVWNHVKAFSKILNKR